MDSESENPPPPLLSVEEAAEQAILFSRVLCPFYDSEPESDSNSDSQSDSDLSTLSDDDDYHSLPSSPMASLAPESDPFLLDSSLDFFDSCPMETDDISFFDEFESDRNSDLVGWVSTERMSRYSMEVVSEQEADADLGSDGLPDPTVVDSDDLRVSRFEVESDLEGPFPANVVISTYSQLELEADVDPDPYWADTVEFSSVQEMDVLEPEVTSVVPVSPDNSFLFDNLPDDLFDCLPEPEPNPNPDTEPDWDAVSTDSSSVPDLEDMVRNLEWEVLLAVNNIYENDAEITFFRQFLEQDSAVKGGPPASKSVVESLPSVTVDENQGDLQCAVCKESVLVGESVKRLPCSHDYHASCILPWLGIRNTCPLCRFELPTDDPNYESWRARQENQV